MKDWTIGKRITFAFSIVLMGAICMGLLTYVEDNVTKKAVAEVTGNCLPSLELISDARTVTHSTLALTYQHIAAPSQTDMDQIENQITADAAKVTQDLEAYGKLATGEDREVLEQIKIARTNYLVLRSHILISSRSATNAETSAEVYQKARKELDPATDQLVAMLNKCQDLEKTEADASSDAAVTAMNRNGWILFWGSLSGMILCGSLAFIIARGTTRVLQDVSTTLDHGASQVALAASQVSEASQALASGSSQQASSIEQSSSSLEELASMTKRNAESTRKATDLAKQARDAADKGVADMQTMANAMDAIKMSSDDIAKIIKTIDEIAFQTNILALNAAVEAARAGEAGMGFAVVADEVRNLAQRCAQAARETSGKIESAITKSSQGVEITGKVSTALNEIVTKVRQVDELSAEIAEASREQTDGISLINGAVGQMDRLTQSNTASAEESAAAAEELNAQAQQMRESVSKLLHLVGSNQASATAFNNESARKAGIPSRKTLTSTHSFNGSTNGHKSAEASFLVPNGTKPELVSSGDFRDF